MTTFSTTTALAAALCLVASARQASAQQRVWEQDTSHIVSSITREGMTGGVFSDWAGVLRDFESESTRTRRKADSLIADGRARLRCTTTFALSGRTLTLPSYPSENGTDLWMLTEEGMNVYLALAAPPYWQDVDPQVLRWARHFILTHRTSTIACFRRYSRWKAYIEDTFAAGGVPPELGMLCIIESGCTESPVSSAGAVGMWQFMPGAARRYGLTTEGGRDERFDPVKATKAAARYLRDAYGKTGSWAAAAAAYNCGINRVRGLQSKFGTDWDDFKDKTPQETRQYVPALIAIYYAWTYRDRLGLNN